MGKTKISWTEETWNPVTGCSHVSEGCRNCYAERMDKRIRGARGEEFKPWTASNAAYNVRLWPDRLDAPLHWKKPRRVFVNSMSDLFHELVPPEFTFRVFLTMSMTPQHTYQILTKRPQWMLAHLKAWERNESPFSDSVVNLPNVWLGVSVEDQKTADERIPLLLQTPAAVRFVSAEPLLGLLQLDRCLSVFGIGQHYNAFSEGLNWVIVGGESGPHFRPMNLDWARSLRDQCVNAQVPFFYKQASGPRPGTNALLDGMEWHQYPA